jgi:hypothetical protein
LHHRRSFKSCSSDEPFGHKSTELGRVIRAQKVSPSYKYFRLSELDQSSGPGIRPPRPGGPKLKIIWNGKKNMLSRRCAQVRRVFEN